MSIEAIKEALAAGPDPNLILHPLCADNWEANHAYAEACNPSAIRSLIERLEAAERKVTELRGDHVPTPDDIEAQDWAGMDGAIAYHLIDRHAENWSHIGRLMHAWRDAAIAAAMQSGGMAEEAE